MIGLECADLSALSPERAPALCEDRSAKAEVLRIFEDMDDAAQVSNQAGLLKGGVKCW